MRIRPRIWNRADPAEATRRVRTARPRAQLRQGRTDWYRITNLADGVDEVYIYDEIGWFGVTAADLIQQLRELTSKRLSVRLNTPGGDAFDSIAIMNALRAHPATVEVTVDSLAASGGSIIAMGGDTVTMAPASQMMIHNASGLVIGNAVDMREMADLLERQDANIASIYQARAGGKLDDWRAAMQAETWYSAQEAVDAGLAETVGTVDSQTQNSWDLSIYAYAGRADAPAPYVPDGPAADEPAAESSGFDLESFRDGIRAAAQQAIADAPPKPAPAPEEPVYTPTADLFREAFEEACR
jgi:ATP-dependent protease ClpP protease subunit